MIVFLCETAGIQLWWGEKKFKEKLTRLETGNTGKPPDSEGVIVCLRSLNSQGKVVTELFEEGRSMVRAAFRLDNSVVAKKIQLRLSGSGQGW